MIQFVQECKENFQKFVRSLFYRLMASLSADTGVPVIAKLPLDPIIGKSCDDGASLFADFPDSDVVRAYSDLARRLAETVKTK